MSWKTTLAAIAPTLATAIGGPFAGAATKFLAKEFLGDENASEQEIGDFIASANPETLAAIKEADNRFKLAMEKNGIDVFKIEADDKKNARKENKLSNMPALLSILLTLFAIAIVIILFYLEPPEGARNVLYMMLGVVIKEWSNAMHYWFGTTRSSSEKNQKMGIIK